MKFLKLFEELRMTTNLLNETTSLYINNDTNEITLYDSSKGCDGVLAYIGLSEYSSFYTFPVVAADKGYGPMIYEFGMMFAGDKGLIINRDGDIRGDAFNVWKRFYHSNVVKKETLDLSDTNFNFAIVTGEEDTGDDYEKLSQLEYFTDEGFKEDIEIYNTIMYMKPSNEYKRLIDMANNFDLDQEEVSEYGSDFFDYRYNE